MDQELIRFRQAADRENRGRRGLRRRYSPTLQHQAVDYWRARRHQGAGLRTVATALGVAPWSLHRWTQQSKRRPHFRPVQVSTAEPSPAQSSVVVTLTRVGPRIEGLTVETAARLVTLLR